MKIILIFSLIAILFIGISDHAFADVTIVPVSGSGAPGCESSACYSPSVATVNVGDVIIFQIPIVQHTRLHQVMVITIPAVNLTQDY